MFFNNYPRVLYKFGQETSLTNFQNISVYSDVIDQIKDNINFYELYTIQDGERPDIISYEKYGTVKYYWTIYLLNDNLRSRGFPLTTQQIIEKCKKELPEKTLTTTEVDHLFTNFKIGTTFSGQLSGATGQVIKRNLELGQVTYKSLSGTIQSGESIVDQTDITKTINVTSNTDEYLSVHHYEDTDGNRVDIDPYAGPGALLTPKTQLDNYQLTNDNLRVIKIIRPDSINQIAKAYNEALRT